MIIVDTNVFSAMMRLKAEPQVRIWLDRPETMNLRVSAPTIFEIERGISDRPIGARRRELESHFANVMTGAFANSILPFDGESAALAGRVHSKHKAAGRNVDVPDSLIAGIALLHRAAIATRNTRDFSGLGIPLVNPWE